MRVSEALDHLKALVQYRLEDDRTAVATLSIHIRAAEAAIGQLRAMLRQSKERVKELTAELEGLRASLDASNPMWDEPTRQEIANLAKCTRARRETDND